MNEMSHHRRKGVATLSLFATDFAEQRRQDSNPW
jgi:hypothetical protein